MKTLQFEYSLLEQEFQEFIYYATWLSPEQKDHRFSYFLNTAFSYIILVGFIGIIMRKELPLSAILIFAVIFGLLHFLFSYQRVKEVPRKITDKLVREKGGEIILGNRKVILHEDGIAVVNQVSELKYSWKGIVAKIEHNSCYYLYTGPRDAIIVPKRIFSSSLEAEEFKLYLAQYLSILADFPDIT